MSWEGWPQEPYCESGEITWWERAAVIGAVAMAWLVVAAILYGVLKLMGVV